MSLNKESNILITGGSGFIGTNLVSYFLEKGYTRILSLDIQKPKIDCHTEYWKYCDLRNQESLTSLVSNFNPDYVIHLAAETALIESKGIEFYSTNTTGLKNLVVCLSSQEKSIYTIFTSTMLVNESNGVYSPNTLYGKSKVQGEEIVKNSILTNYCIVRPTSIWGPWFGEPYLKFFKIILSNRYFGLSRDRSATKTFGYVSNVVAQYVGILKNSDSIDKQKTFYLGDNPSINIHDFAKLIANISNTRIKIVPYGLIRVLSNFGD